MHSMEIGDFLLPALVYTSRTQHVSIIIRGISRTRVVLPWGNQNEVKKTSNHTVWKI